MFKRLSFIGTAALIAVGTTATPSWSRLADGNSRIRDVGCSWIFMCSGGAHIASGGEPAVRPTHGDCKICEGPQPADCHEYCLATRAGSGGDGDNSYAAAVDAAKRNDSGALLLYALLEPEYAQFNAERSSVQLLDCQGNAVIASLPVSRSQVAVAELKSKQLQNAEE